MQNKGALKLLTSLLIIVCAFQLSFTYITQNVQKEASAQGPAQEQIYLDSIKSEVVYNLGFSKYTYSECLDREINLGLDLRGGMNVTLEIAVEDIIKALAGSNSADPSLNAALASAKIAQGNSREDFLTLFAREFKTANPGKPLSPLFQTEDLRTRIKPGASDEEVLKVLRVESENAISNSFNIISNRIDRFGVVQPNIQRLGTSGRILVELPGVKDPERVRKLLQGTASLEFREVHNANIIAPMMYQLSDQIAKIVIADSTNVVDTTKVEPNIDPKVVAKTDTKVAAKTAVKDTTKSVVAALQAKDTTATKDGNKTLAALLQINNYNTPVIGIAHARDTMQINKYLAMAQISDQVYNMKFVWGVKEISNDKVKKGSNLFELYALKQIKGEKPRLDGGVVVNAEARHTENGSDAEVSMTMNGEGAKEWAHLTGELAKAGTPQNIQFIAIVLDDCVYSCPSVKNEISGGSSSISGNFQIQEAKDLANVLKSGKLPAPARIVQEAIVGPTLGQESINAGVTSFALAFILVLLYMIFFYNKAGLIASIALIINLFLLFGVLVSFGAVLTLPGIAGIVLTMGMAVDANVLIFERVKEELRAGKGLAMSIKEGYSNAYSAIIDGNVTTILTGIVLFIFGSGPVQGFATTLIIGILTSLYCAIFITRLIFEALLKRNKNISFSHKFSENFLGNTKFNFIGARKIVYIISSTVIVIMGVSLATNGLQLGIDFTGGRTYTVRFDKELTADQVRASLEGVFSGDCVVKQYGTKEQKQMSITTQYKYNVDAPEVTNEINQMMYKALAPLYDGSISEDDFTTTVHNPLGIISSQKVNAAIAHDIIINSFIAVLMALVMIGLYIAVRFRNWQYGLGGLVSLAHDAFLTVGLFSLLYKVMPFNLTIDQSFIAAVLTIIGYSINDTVIIFDRIRENTTLHPKHTLKENMNNSTNQTLARTVNTAGTTIVVLLAIFLFGGEVIQGFVFALLFGIAIGTYSSIFIATPIAYDSLMRSAKKKALKAELEAAPSKK